MRRAAAQESADAVFERMRLYATPRTQACYTARITEAGHGTRGDGPCGATSFVPAIAP